MNLTPDEADLFFETYEGLLTFVHQSRKLEPPVRSVEEFSALPVAQQVPARTALYAERQLLEDYLSQAGKLPAEKLALLQSWRKMIPGRFTVVKQLKSGAIFQGDGGRFFQVLGLRNSVEFAMGHMPTMTETCLLPFRGRLVYDGIMRSYRIVFGSGARKLMNEEYQRARRKGAVCTSLEPEQAPPPPARPPAPNRSVETADIVTLVSGLRGGNTPFESPAYTLLRAAADVAHVAASGERGIARLDRELSKVRRAVTRLQNVILDEM